ncbi:butyrophilin-like protein 3 [Cheilinus undulatus]|uniref:butyrophilin-like protein 3 n=1 Tax=Cheilinus undulatus TaxID=241271 RepID=UPI001BD69CF0|nr:butyrophilin-like protein 3 [Cheilinus undulatus]
MGILRWHVLLIAALSVSLLEAAPASLQVFVGSPISVARGHTTTLPCWLSPKQSAEALEVRWYRSDNFDSPVLLYQGKSFQNASQDASYSGRVSFGLKDAVSGGLKVGDVSLKLTDVTLDDEGQYTCYVSSNQGYDSDSVNLVVTQTGTSPLLSAVWIEDNMLNMSCQSEGWYPQPSLRWSDPNKDLSSNNTKSSEDFSGLKSVHSWILVPSSSEVSSKVYCSVSLPGEEAKVARVHLEKPPQAEPEGSHVGWIFFALLSVAVVIATLLFYFRKRWIKPKTESGNPEENCALLTKGPILPTDLSEAKKHFVNVALAKVTNPFLKIKDDRKVRDTVDAAFPDGPDVTCLTAIKGTPGFSSGRHYWEVSLDQPNTDPKKSWWIGVTSATDISEGSSPTTSNGFWFLSSSSDRAGVFQFNTEPNILLPVYSRPQIVGVDLNYDDGKLSFYNAKDESLIGSLKVNFTGEVFPLFNPGKGDQSPMEILQGEGPGKLPVEPGSQEPPNDNNSHQIEKLRRVTT